MFIRLLTALVNGSNHTKCGSLSNQKVMTHLLLLIYILMNTANIYITLDRCLKVVILLITYLVKYVLYM